MVNSKYLQPNEVTQWRLWPTDESCCICSIMNVTNWVSATLFVSLGKNTAYRQRCHQRERKGLRFILRSLLCFDIHTSMSTLKRSTLSTLWFSDVSVVPNIILRGALTRNYDRDCPCGPSPAIDIPLWMVNSLRMVAMKSYKSYKNYKMTPLMQAMWKMHEMFAQPCAASSST